MALLSSEEFWTIQCKLNTGLEKNDAWDLFNHASDLERKVKSLQVEIEAKQKRVDKLLSMLLDD